MVMAQKNATNTTNTTTNKTSSTVNKTCPATCSACTNSNNCTNCKTGNTLYKGQCFPCSTNCTLCKSAKNCEKCKDGFFIKKNNFGIGQCKECNLEIKGCKQCAVDRKGYSYCKQCLPNHVRNYWWDKCTPSTSTGSCEVMITEGNSKECKKCKAGYYKKDDQCKPCGVKNCVDCPKSWKCYKCKPGFAYKFTWGKYECVPESQVGCKISNCQTCDKTSSRHVCSACKTGFKLNSWKSGCIDNSKCGTQCSDCKGSGLWYCRTCNKGSIKLLSYTLHSNIGNVNGKCLSQSTCPTDQKFYHGQKKVYALVNSTCIPCPYRTTACSFKNNQLVVDKCESGYVPTKYNSGKNIFYYCKSCSLTSGCKVCDINKKCKECQIDFILNTNGQCEKRYKEDPAKTGNYIDKKTGQSNICPQKNVLRCSGPAATNIIGCKDEFSVFKGEKELYCRPCTGNCRHCYWKGDTEVCLSCNYKTLAIRSGSSYKCVSAVPKDHVVYIDSLSLFNFHNLWQLFGLPGNGEVITAVYPDPVTKKLWEIFKAITPVANEKCKYFFRSIQKGGKCFSDKDKLPFKILGNEFTHGNKSIGVSLALGQCPYNCIACPANLVKFTKEGKQYCLKECPNDFEPIKDAKTNEITCQVPKDKIIPFIVVHSYSLNPETPNTQDFSRILNMTVIAANKVAIQNVTWSLTRAIDYRNTSRTFDEMKKVIMNGVFTGKGNINIPVANFQKFPYSKLFFTAVLFDAKNRSVTTSKSINISPGTIINTFTIQPNNGTSVETVFNASYSIKNEYINNVTKVNGSSNSWGVISCYPDKEINLASNTKTPSTKSNSNANSGSSTSSNSGSSGSSNASTSIESKLTGEPTDNKTPSQNTLNLNDNVTEINSNVGTTNTTNTTTDPANEIENLLGNFTFDSVVNIAVESKNGSTNFRLPLVDVATAIKCYISFDFNINGSVVEVTRPSNKLSLYPSKKNLSEIMKIINSNDNVANSSSDVDNSVDLLQSLNKNLNTSVGNKTRSFVCPKGTNANSLNTFCCPPDNLCSNRGECMEVDEEGNPVNMTANGLGNTPVANSTNNSSKNGTNKNYQCFCDIGFQGINCQYSDSDFSSFSNAMESIFSKYDKVNIDTNSNSALLEHFESLLSLSKMDIQNFLTISKLLDRSCKYYSNCKNIKCLEKSISILDNLMGKIPSIPLKFFIKKNGKGNLTVAEKLKAINLRKVLTLRNLECFDKMTARLTKVMPANQTEIVMKVGTTSTFVKKGVKGLPFSSNCGALGTSSSLSKSKCAIDLPKSFTSENIKGDNFFLLFSSIPRESVGSVKGSSGLNSDITEISLNDGNGQLSVKNSKSKHCVEISMINYIAPALMVMDYFYLRVAHGLIKKQTL